MAHMSSTVVPNVLVAYACKCGACRRTCCRADWDVAVTRAERDRAHETTRTHPELAGRDAHIIENPHAHGPIDACRIEFDARGFCPLMTADGICEWHAVVGAPVSRTCAEFPRVVVDVAGVRYAAASVACEAVVEAAYAASGPVQLQTCTGPTHFDDLYPMARIDAATSSKLTWHADLQGLLERGMAMLQTQGRPLTTRVADVVRMLWEARDPDENSAPAPAQSLPMPPETAVLGLVAKSYADAVSLVGAHADHAAHILRGLGFECEAAATGLVSVRLAQPGMLGELAAHADAEFDAALARLATLEFVRVLLACVERGPRDVAMLFSTWFATMRASLIVEVAAGAPPSSPAFVDAVVRTQRALAHTRDVEGLKGWLRACGLYTVDALAALVVDE